MKILAYDIKKKKTILCGMLVDGIFYKYVLPIHFMKVVNGYGISEDGFQKIVEAKGKKVIITEMSLNQAWESDIKDWLENSKIADYGNGKQRFLSLKYMHTHKVKQE